MFGLVVLGLVFLAPEPAQWDVKSKAAEAPAGLAAAVREALDSVQVQVHDPSGEVVARLWFAKQIPAQATPEQVRNGVGYREIPEGTLLGVIQFPKQFLDTRKQEVAAGVYTLRFAVQPEIGDHAGTAPHPEFALLSPAAEDKTAEPIEVKDLLKQSRLITEGDHPAVMLLFPINPKETATKLTRKDDNFQVLQVGRTLTLSTGEKAPLTFAITVDGQSKTR